MKALSGQNLLDIAIQHLGTAEAAFVLATENDISLTDNLAVGEELAEIDIVNRDIFNYYIRNSFKPATGETEAEKQLGGIEFMGIEIDLIVS